MLIRTHIDEHGNAWVKITNGKQLINMERYETRNSGGYRDTVEIAVLGRKTTHGAMAAERIRKLFKKMDKQIAVVEKLFGGKAVAIFHGKSCSRTHPLVDGSCDRTLDPLNWLILNSER